MSLSIVDNETGETWYLYGDDNGDYWLESKVGAQGPLSAEDALETVMWDLGSSIDGQETADKVAAWLSM